MSYDETITLRTSKAADAEQLLRLAALDSAEPLAGPALLAEVDGQVCAALPLDGSRPIADPFAETAHVVALLRVHARALGAVSRTETRGTGALARNRLALAA